MKLWSDLVTSALLGTERGAPAPSPAAAGPLGEHLARIPAEDREQAHLSAAALLTSYRQAGRTAGAALAPVPVECPPDALAECRPKTAHLIAMALDKQHAPVLPEALGLLAGVRRRLPHAMLPDLLNAGRGGHSLRPAIQAVADRRGFWLAAQNPEWSYLASKEDTEVWTEGGAAARLSYYTQVRAADPERARALLSEAWTTESAGDRAAFLDAWEADLSMEDEPFLESALDDRSKEVRKTAAGLLTKLPGSRLVQRMIARAEPLIALHSPLIGRTRLDAAPPDAGDAAMARDGIEIKPPQGEGEKAFWLRQIVAAVPLEFWTAKFGRSAPKLVALARQNEWSAPLLIGWRQAARRTQSTDWLLALIQDALEHDPAAATTIPELASRLSAADFEALLGPMVAGVPMSEKHPALALAARHPDPWSLEFARSMARTIAAAIIQDQTGRAHWWTYANLLSDLGRHAPPGFAEEFRTLWPEDHPSRGQWGRYVEEAAQTLSFRNSLRTAIAEENAPL